MGTQVPRRKLGNTGLEVPIIGFGASPLGGIYQVRISCLLPFIKRVQYNFWMTINLMMLCAILKEPLDEPLAIEAVHEAFKFGINLFDTSPYYGLTRSEKVSQKPHAGLIAAP